MKMSNEELRQKTRMQQASKEVKQRRWKWIGHVQYCKWNRPDTQGSH